MWFNNLQLYRLTKPFTLSSEELEQQLAADSFSPCGSLQPASYGWVSPLGRHGDMLTHSANGYIMICARNEERILPSTVVKEVVNEKIAELEAAQGRPVRRRERDELRDEVTFELLPKAFTRSTRTYAYIAPKERLLVVNASSAKKGEELVSQLRKSLGSFPAVVPVLNNAPASIMTRWVSGEQLPSDIEIQDECELRDVADEGGIIRCKRQDLFSDEIQAHLQAGKQVVKLAVEWSESLNFVLGEDLSIKRLRFADKLLEESEGMGSDDPVTDFDNDFAVMTLELSRFIPRLLELLGGENEVAYGSGA